MLLLIRYPPKTTFWPKHLFQKRSKIRSQNQKIWKKYWYTDSELSCFKIRRALQIEEKLKMGVKNILLPLKKTNIFRKPLLLHFDFYRNLETIIVDIYHFVSWYLVLPLVRYPPKTTFWPKHVFQKRSKIRSWNQKIRKKYWYADSEFSGFKIRRALEIEEKLKTKVKKGVFSNFQSQYESKFIVFLQF